MDLTEFLKQEGVDAYLIHSNSTCNADMYYATGFLAGDAFSYLHTGGDILLVSAMEKGRARKESRIADVRSSSDYGLKEKLKKYKEPGKAYCMMLSDLLEAERCSRVAVPRDFPLGLAQCLGDAGFTIKSTKSPFLVKREKKTDSEIRYITMAQRACEQAVARALDVIARSQVVDGRLISDGSPLTAEDVRAVIHHSLLDCGCEADDTIVACGAGSANPHWRGSGVLEAHRPIVVDVFPRHTFYRYYSDMTRTVVKGEPDPRILEMYEAVLAAQQVAFDMIKPGISGSEVHQAVSDSLIEAGFHVGEEEGFIHSTGHGVGLDIHERPGLGLQEHTLEAGNVVTVEPGLYYRDVGGVRMEDIVVVTAGGCKNLTIFDRKLQL